MLYAVRYRTNGWVVKAVDCKSIRRLALVRIQLCPYKKCFMRLAYDINYEGIFNNIISIDYNNYTGIGICLLNNLLFYNGILSVELSDIMIDLFNYFHSYIMGYKLGYLYMLNDCSSMIAIISQFSMHSTLWYEIWLDSSLDYGVSIWYGIFFYCDYSVMQIFCIFFIFLFFYRILLVLGIIMGRPNVGWNEFLSLFTYIWVRLGLDKLESAEESVSIIILWPWCIFLIFTHLFMIDNHSFLFGFAEWGLPILYGLILLFEHFWMFGTYILVYLMGIRGRRSFIITFIEDMIAISIMFARVILQSIRGIIVGMFHFICREALLNMTHWWTHETWFNHGSGLILCDNSFRSDLIFIIVDFFLAAGSLVLVMAIMFLQLIFLIVSIWLFCKCWFMSSDSIFVLQPKLNFKAYEDRIDSNSFK